MNHKFEKILSLKPISIHFSIYGNQDFRLTHDYPFWSSLQYSIFSHTIDTYQICKNKELISEEDILRIVFHQICSKEKLILKEYVLTLKQFIEQLYECKKKQNGKIKFFIDVENTLDKFYCNKICNDIQAGCLWSMKNNEKVALIIEFRYEEILEAIASYEEASISPSIVEEKRSNVKEDKTVEHRRNNSQEILSFANMECGMVTDEQLASTIFGIAVKKDNGWVVYKKEERKLVYLPVVPFTNFSLYIIPITSLEEGDFLKVESNYYYFIKKEGDLLTLMDVQNGFERKIYVARNILDFTLYSKIVTILDFMPKGSV